MRKQMKHESIILYAEYAANYAAELEEKLKEEYVRGCNDTNDEWKKRIKLKIKSIPRCSMTPTWVEDFMKELI